MIPILSTVAAHPTMVVGLSLRQSREKMSLWTIPLLSHTTHFCHCATRHISMWRWSTQCKEWGTCTSTSQRPGQDHHEYEGWGKSSRRGWSGELHNACYISASEALWKIYGFTMECSHTHTHYWHTHTHTQHTYTHKHTPAHTQMYMYSTDRHAVQVKHHTTHTSQSEHTVTHTHAQMQMHTHTTQNVT